MEMIIIGILMMAGGFASVIYGDYMNHDISSQLAHYSSGGDPGTNWIGFGVLAILVGGVLLFWGFEKRKLDKKSEQDALIGKLSRYQRNLLEEYQAQLKNGVISKEEYLEKKEKLLIEGDG